MQVAVIIGSTKKAALASCRLVQISPVARVVATVESKEQTAPAICSLIRVPLPQVQSLVLV